MIPALALLAAGSAQPVWEAERAFAARAQRDGTWTAFRATTASEGVMFAPKMARTLDLLAKAKDPPAGFLQWWPARAITACDGSLAFSTGPWVRPGDGGKGTFSTIWRREADGGWRWLYDGGRDTPERVSAGVGVRATKPVCRNLAAAGALPVNTGRTDMAALAAEARDDLLIQEDNRMPAAAPRPLALDVGARLLGGRSRDGSLRWQVDALNGAKDEGARILRVYTWDGARYRLAVLDVIGAG